jgi:hypothetical protein
MLATLTLERDAAMESNVGHPGCCRGCLVLRLGVAPLSADGTLMQGQAAAQWYITQILKLLLRHVVFFFIFFLWLPVHSCLVLYSKQQ